MRFTRFLVLLLISGSLLAWPGLVLGDTISIGLQEGGAITTVTTGAEPSVTEAFGTFSSVTVSGHGQSSLTAPDLLFADNIATATSSGGTLLVWVTDQDLTSPVGTIPFTSSFTANQVPSGWTISEATFLSATNAVFSGSPLDSASFSAIGTSTKITTAATGGGPYSVTELFIITAPGAGDANNTIDLSATPVSTPESPALIALGLGLIAVGFLFRRRVQSA